MYALHAWNRMNYGFHWEKFSGLHNPNYLTLVHSEEGLVVEGFYLL